jgi:hypothetical protein
MQVKRYNSKTYWETGKFIPEVAEVSQDEIMSAMQTLNEWINPGIEPNLLYSKLESLNFDATCFEWEQFLKS